MNAFPQGETTDIDLNEIDQALYATQGGGLATWSEDLQTYVWYELPPEYNDPEFRARYPEITDQIGDAIPSEWSVVPVNQAARDTEYDEDFDLVI